MYINYIMVHQCNIIHQIISYIMRVIVQLFSIQICSHKNWIQATKLTKTNTYPLIAWIIYRIHQERFCLITYRG